MRAINYISLLMLVVSIAACIYDAYRQNMFCVVWAMNTIINFINIKSAVE